MLQQQNFQRPQFQQFPGGQAGGMQQGNFGQMPMNQQGQQQQRPGAFPQQQFQGGAPNQYFSGPQQGQPQQQGQAPRQPNAGFAPGSPNMGVNFGPSIGPQDKLRPQQNQPMIASPIGGLQGSVNAPQQQGLQPPQQVNQQRPLQGGPQGLQQGPQGQFQQQRPAGQPGQPPSLQGSYNPAIPQQYNQFGQPVPQQQGGFLQAPQQGGINQSVRSNASGQGGQPGQFQQQQRPVGPGGPGPQGYQPPQQGQQGPQGVVGPQMRGQSPPQQPGAPQQQRPGQPVPQGGPQQFGQPGPQGQQGQFQQQRPGPGGAAPQPNSAGVPHHNYLQQPGQVTMQQSPYNPNQQGQYQGQQQQIGQSVRPGQQPLTNSTQPQQPQGLQPAHLSPPKVSTTSPPQQSLSPGKEKDSPTGKIIAKMGQYSPGKKNEGHTMTSDELLVKHITNVPKPNLGNIPKVMPSSTKSTTKKVLSALGTGKSAGKKQESNKKPIGAGFTQREEPRVFTQEKSRLVESLISPKFGQHVEGNRFATLEDQTRHLEKLAELGNELEEERKALAQLYAEEEMKECTFHPEILEIEGDREIRTLERFLDDQKIFLETVEAKRAAMREGMMNENPEDETYHPEISERTKQLAQKRYSTNANTTVFDRLYAEANAKKGDLEGMMMNTTTGGAGATGRAGKTARTTADPNNTFRPTIQAKSQRLQREAPIDAILYNDAMKRMEKNEKIQKEKPKQTKAVISSESKSLFIRKFLRRYDAVVSEYLAPNTNGRLALRQTAEVLHKLGYIVDPDKIDNPIFIQDHTLLMDLWNVLRGEEHHGITKRNLLVFLLAIFGLGFDVPKYGVDVEARPQTSQPAGHKTKGSPEKGGVPDPLEQHEEGEEGKRQSVEEKKSPGKRTQQGSAHKRESSGQNVEVSDVKKEFNDQYFDNVLRSAEKNAEEQKKGSEEVKAQDQQPNASGIGYFDNEGDFFLKNEDVSKIQKVYDIFYINHLGNQHARKAADRATKQSEATLTAEQSLMKQKAPISNVSEVLAEQYRAKLKDNIMPYFENPSEQPTKITYVDLLIKQRTLQLQAHIGAAREKDSEELKECTFHPTTLAFVAENTNQEEQAQGQEGDDMISPNKGTKRNAMPTGSLGKHRAFELYALAKPSSQRRDRDPKEIEYEKYCDECTFMPDLSSTRDKRAGDADVPAKNIDLAIDRMRKGKQLRDYEKMMKTRGINNSPDQVTGPWVFEKNNSKFKSAFETADNRGGPRSTNKGRMTTESQQRATFDQQRGSQNGDIQEHEAPRVEAGHHHQIEGIRAHGKPTAPTGGDTGVASDVLKERAPLLFVDVNLGSGRTERIIVYEGDKSEELAEKFGDEHGLDEEMKHRLKELLDSQIANLLTRIEEEMPSLQSDDDTSRKKIKNQLHNETP